MSKGLTIIDKDYTRWVEDLSVRYRQSQIKAAVRAVSYTHLTLPTIA